MASVGTPHVAKVGILFTWGTTANQCLNQVYIQDATDAIFASPAATCATIQGKANLDLLPALYPLVQLSGVEFEDVRTVPFGGIVVPQVAQPGTKAGTGANVPSSCCIAVKKSTGNLGRSGRGRWYWPIGDGGGLNGATDQVASAYVTQLLAALQAFQTDVEIALGGVKMGIVSYQLNKVPRAAGLFQQITSWSVSDTFIDSQRRRLQGRGR